MQAHWLQRWKTGKQLSVLQWKSGYINQMFTTPPCSLKTGLLSPGIRCVMGQSAEHASVWGDLHQNATWFSPWVKATLTSIINASNGSLAEDLTVLLIFSKKLLIPSFLHWSLWLFFWKFSVFLLKYSWFIVFCFILFIVSISFLSSGIFMISFLLLTLGFVCSSVYSCFRFNDRLFLWDVFGFLR